MKGRHGKAGLLAALALLVSSGAFAQYFGHEYEGRVAPIREGKESVIPLDTQHPNHNVWTTPRDGL
jgi:hypothetical protein